MSGFDDLARLGVQVRPLSNLRPKPGNQGAQFRSTVGQTATLLARELRYLGSKNAVLELDLRERDIRLDGMPRSDARPGNPTVVLSFDSKFGPLRYATCEYTSWDDNLRAIALAMEALRAVDRYGVSKRGEQYVGWRQLPASTDPADSLTSVEEARALIDGYGGLIEALKKTHPDHGGDAGEFRRVMKAKELLGR